MTSSWLNQSLRKIEQRVQGKRDLHEAARNILERYEARRAAGRHAGPPLRALRIYRIAWQFDPWARNADHPEHRTLLCEATQATSSPQREQSKE